MMIAPAAPTTFAASGGLDLVYHHWPAVSATPRAALITVHGIGDHGAALPYRYFAEHYAARGYMVYSYDARGHGRSPGLRGYVDGWGDFRDDLGAFVRLVRGREPRLPLFLVGLSLGAAVALDYALAQPEELRGVVAVAAPLGPTGVAPAALVVGRLVSRLLPRARVALKLDVGNVSRDEAAMRAYLADPLFHQQARARTLTSFLATITAIHARTVNWRLPLLMLHGEADTIAAPDTTFFNASPAPDKMRRTYPGARHNLFLETNRDEVFADIVRWLDERC